MPDVRFQIRILGGLAMLALILASCVSSGAGAPPAASCPESAPGRIPPVAEAVDVDAVERWLREAGTSGTSTDADVARTAVLAIRRSTAEADGTTPWVRVVESDFPDDFAEELAQTVVRTLPPLAEPTEEGGPPLPLFRLHVEAGDDPVLSVGPATSCRPLLLNGPEVQSLLRPLGQRFPAGGRIVVDLLVAAEGRVGDYALREGTGNPALNEALVNVARQMRFRPAQVDGHPWEAWIQMPVRLQVR